MRFRLVEGLHMHAIHLLQRWLSQTQRAAVCISARKFRTPRDVSQTGRDGTTPQDGNNSIRSPRLNSPVLIGGDTTASPTIIVSQDIVSPKVPTSSVEHRLELPVSHYHEIMVIYPYPFFAVITLLFYQIILLTILYVY